MWRLRTLVAVEKEAKWADSGDGRHRQILPDCSSVPVALPAAGRALHAGVTDGVRREYRVLGRPVRRRPKLLLDDSGKSSLFCACVWPGSRRPRGSTVIVFTTVHSSCMEAPQIQAKIWAACGVEGWLTAGSARDSISERFEISSEITPRDISGKPHRVKTSSLTRWRRITFGPSASVRKARLVALTSGTGRSSARKESVYSSLG